MGHDIHVPHISFDLSWDTAALLFWRVSSSLSVGRLLEQHYTSSDGKHNHNNMVYNALRSAGGVRRPLRSVRKLKSTSNYAKRTERSMIEYSFFFFNDCSLQTGDLIMTRVPHRHAFRRKQLGRHIRFASRAAPPATLAHMSGRTYFLLIYCKRKKKKGKSN